jgi:hypothetical protein
VSNIRAGYYWQPTSRVENQAQASERHHGRRNGGAGNGVPRSYEELIQNYHGVVMSIAAKAGLSGPDAEDAAQMIEMRFWARGGLADYDPERLFEPPSEGWSDGRVAVPRTARFASMFKTYVILSMRGERDRMLRWHKHHGCEDEAQSLTCEDPASDAEMRDWVRRACRRLINAGQPEWAAAVAAAAGGQLEKREEWAQVLGCKVRSCRWAQEQMTARLTAVGMGPESLRECG